MPSSTSSLGPGPLGSCLQPWRRAGQIFLTPSFLSNTFPSTKSGVLSKFTGESPEKVAGIPQL